MRISTAIEWTLWLILLTAILYAQYEGMYIRKQVAIIETCQGEPINAYQTLPNGCTITNQLQIISQYKKQKNESGQ